MRSFKIETRHKQLLRRASRQKVEDYFDELPRGFRATNWLRDTNRYRRLCTTHYERDVKPVPPLVKDRQLTAYISASSPAHVIDGWSFLGRAVDAALRGDAYSAIHFGYYAELRAAMSLLASEGIGIFSSRHPVVDDAGRTHLFPPGKQKASTHSVVWPVLRYWATLSRAEGLLDELVNPNSIRLSSWLNALGASKPVRAVAQQWLSFWGLDLAVVDDDHDSRNLASYRPSEFRLPHRLDVYELTQFVEELWQLFEPGVGRRFPNLERLLLRNAWRKSSRRAPAVHDVESLGMTTSEASDWIAFLQKADDPLPLRLAEKRVPVEDSDCHLRIISRAALLLFVATAAGRRLLSNAAYSLNDVRFWWGRHGEDRALWNIAESPADPQDLWADIAESINDSSAWRARYAGGRPSLREWRTSQTGALSSFGGFELVGIWGLLP
ncbi:MAG TPA: hypothetical protein VMR33_06325 [Candidatus Baltobacteraceae bacterium]|jgi:hypothetical protein|nr:hypothetical protein [Candidatus Baltobacteraceae bacterium]